jgi:hypothetical protein
MGFIVNSRVTPRQQSFIWFYKSKTQAAYIWCFYAAGLIIEISQMSEKIPGTFDLLDLFFLGIGAFVEGLLYNDN